MITKVILPPHSYVLLLLQGITSIVPVSLSTCQYTILAVPQRVGSDVLWSIQVSTRPWIRFLLQRCHSRAHFSLYSHPGWAFALWHSDCKFPTDYNASVCRSQLPLHSFHIYSEEPPESALALSFHIVSTRDVDATIPVEEELLEDRICLPCIYLRG